MVDERLKLCVLAALAAPKLGASPRAEFAPGGRARKPSLPALQGGYRMWAAVRCCYAVIIACALGHLCVEPFTPFIDVAALL